MIERHSQGDLNGVCVIRGQGRKGPGFDTIRDGRRICQDICEEQQEIDKVTNEDLANLKNSSQIGGSMAAVASSQVQNLFR